MNRKVITFAAVAIAVGVSLGACSTTGSASGVQATSHTVSDVSAVDAEHVHVIALRDRSFDGRRHGGFRNDQPGKT